MAKESIYVVKVGGAVVEDESQLQALLSDFAKVEGRKVLVHGGGRSATRIAAQLGVETHMVEGRRITDDAMIEVVTMVYGGLVNKRVVAALQGRDVNAVGLTGADMNTVLSIKRPVKTVDYGWVGDVKRVDAQALATLVEAGVVPVMAPLTHDGAGHMLNTNADTMASSVACALAGLYDVHLVFCFEKAGVLANPDDDSSVIEVIDHNSYEQLKADGVISGGMIPKLDNSLAAIDAGVSEVIITCSTQLSDLSNGGTHIVK